MILKSNISKKDINRIIKILLSYNSKNNFEKYIDIPYIHEKINVINLNENCNIDKNDLIFLLNSIESISRVTIFNNSFLLKIFSENCSNIKIKQLYIKNNIIERETLDNIIKNIKNILLLDILNSQLPDNINFNNSIETISLYNVDGVKNIKCNSYVKSFTLKTDKKNSIINFEIDSSMINSIFTYNCYLNFKIIDKLDINNMFINNLNINLFNINENLYIQNLQLKNIKSDTINFKGNIKNLDVYRSTFKNFLTNNNIENFKYNFLIVIDLIDNIFDYDENFSYINQFKNYYNLVLAEVKKNILYDKNSKEIYEKLKFLNKYKNIVKNIPNKKNNIVNDF